MTIYNVENRKFMSKQLLLNKIRYLALGFILGVIYMSVISKVTFTNEGVHNDTAVDIFTFSYYRRLLKEMIQDRYLVLKVVDFIRLARKGMLPDDKVIVILRHDVDFSINSAKTMSKIEYEYGIRSTYYIRTRGPYNILEKSNSEWLRWLYANNFEIGLHYETLFFADYNFSVAEDLLIKDVNLLRDIVPVYTICSHGNIAKPTYVNYEILTRNPNLLDELELEGEAYLTIRDIVRSCDRTYRYLSDTNGRWIDWIKELENSDPGSIIYILIHPDWWREGN